MIEAVNEPPKIRALAIVADPSMVDESLIEMIRAHQHFAMTASLLQRRVDRLKTYKGERSKTFGAAVRRTARELEVHNTGEVWERYKEANRRVQDAIGLSESLTISITVEKSDLSTVIAFGPRTVLLFVTHTDAVQAKKAEMQRIADKIDAVQAALAKLIRHGVAGRDEEEAPQATLPGMKDEVAPPPEQWMDAKMRQTIFDTLTIEGRVVESDVKQAAVAQDQARAEKVERDRRQLAELMGNMQAMGLFDGLAADEEDEAAVAEVVEAGGEDPDVDFDGEEDEAPAPVVRTEPIEGVEFVLQPDGPAPGLEDPTKHPALAPGIEAAKARRGRKPTAADAETAKPAAAKTAPKRGGRKPKA